MSEGKNKKYDPDNLSWIDYLDSCSDDNLLKQIKKTKLGYKHPELWCANFSISTFTFIKHIHSDMLTSARLENAAKKRQAEFVASRLLAKTALIELGLKDTSVSRGQNGAPQWTNGIHGSISHHRHMVVVLLGKKGWILGVDIESRLHGISLSAVKRHVLTPNENLFVTSQVTDQEIFMTTLIFSAKEALYKALTPETSINFDIRISELSSIPHNGELRLSLTRTITPALPKGLSFGLKYTEINGNIITWIALPNG